MICRPDETDMNGIGGAVDLMLLRFVAKEAFFKAFFEPQTFSRDFSTACLAGAMGFGHAGDIAARVIVCPIVNGPNGECAAIGRVALSRQNVEDRIVAHWSVLSITARRRIASL
jgi:hypothetical protein